MFNDALNRIAKIQKLDTAILELRRRIDHLDPGKAVSEVRDEAQAQFEEANGKLKALRGELTDLELEQKKIEAKIKSENDRLYSGGVYNAKDAESIDREVKNLKARLGDIDVRILALWEELPPAEEAAKTVEATLAEKQALVDEYMKKYEQVKVEIEQKLAQLEGIRPKAVEAADPAVVAKYERMRKAHGGVGLAKVDEGECEVCRARVPKPLKDAILSGVDLETCEGCGRYLYIETS